MSKDLWEEMGAPRARRRAVLRGMGTQRPRGEHSLGAFQELQGGQVSAVGAGAGGQASWGLWVPGMLWLLLRVLGV